MTALAMPLTARQVEAANSIRDHLPSWVATDQALADVATRFPNMDSASAFVKIAVLDRLYGTNVWVIPLVAEHVAAVFRDGDFLTGEPTELVERLAVMPDRNRWSFAAKFCHFFVSPARFPIYDSYALGTVARHLGRGRHKDADRPYRAFALNLQLLSERAGLTCSWAELDRYLYLAGQYDAWKRNPNAQISRETARLFAIPPPDVAAELDILDGATQVRAPMTVEIRNGVPKNARLTADILSIGEAIGAQRVIIEDNSDPIDDRGERIDRMLIEVWNDTPKAKSRTIRTDADSALWDDFVVGRDAERAGLIRPFAFGDESTEPARRWPADR